MGYVSKTEKKYKPIDGVCGTHMEQKPKQDITAIEEPYYEDTPVLHTIKEENELEEEKELTVGEENE